MRLRIRISLHADPDRHHWKEAQKELFFLQICQINKDHSSIYLSTASAPGDLMYEEMPSKVFAM